MRSKRYSIFTLFLIVTFAVLALAPVNRNTAFQAWYKLNPKNAPSGGRINTGAQWHYSPYYYGDTWFSRYYRFRRWLYPPPKLVVAPRIIIEEDEEDYTGTDSSSLTLSQAFGSERPQ